MSKIYRTPAEGIAGVIRDGITIMAGGFGLCGVPFGLIDAIYDSGARDLTVISNNPGVDGVGLGKLLEMRQITTLIGSYIGENKLFASQYLDGKVKVEFSPQGTLAERIRAGGAGIPAFYTRTGFGTDIARGKELREFKGSNYLLEQSLFADLAVVHAYRGDKEGNLVYRMTARNFNPLMATAARVTVAEVEELVDPGAIDPDSIVTPGVFVDRIVEVGKSRKPIENRTTRPRKPLERGA